MAMSGASNPASGSQSPSSEEEILQELSDEELLSLGEDQMESDAASAVSAEAVKEDEAAPVGRPQRRSARQARAKIKEHCASGDLGPDEKGVPRIGGRGISGNKALQSTEKMTLEEVFVEQPVGDSRRCSCKKSKCLKLYCECFGAGVLCDGGCKCSECSNTSENVDARREAIKYKLSRKPRAFQAKVVDTEEVSDGAVHVRGCHCKRSGCNKKYCECYQSGVACGDACKCKSCKNDGSLMHLRDLGLTGWKAPEGGFKGACIGQMMVMSPVHSPQGGMHYEISDDPWNQPKHIGEKLVDEYGSNLPKNEFPALEAPPGEPMEVCGTEKSEYEAIEVAPRTCVEPIPMCDVELKLQKVLVKLNNHKAKKQMAAAAQWQATQKPTPKAATVKAEQPTKRTPPKFSEWREARRMPVVKQEVKVEEVEEVDVLGDWLGDSGGIDEEDDDATGPGEGFVFGELATSHELADGMSSPQMEAYYQRASLPTKKEWNATKPLYDATIVALNRATQAGQTKVAKKLYEKAEQLEEELLGFAHELAKYAPAWEESIKTLEASGVMRNEAYRSVRADSRVAVKTLRQQKRNHSRSPPMSTPRECQNITSTVGSTTDLQLVAKKLKVAAIVDDEDMTGEMTGWPSDVTGFTGAQEPGASDVDKDILDLEVTIADCGLVIS